MIKITQKDIFYWLIILNLIIWSISAILNIKAYNNLLDALVQDVEAYTISPKMEQVEPTMEEWVKRETEKAGMPWSEAWAVIQCESEWNEWAYGKASDDFGLWQINQIHIRSGRTTLKCALDYKCATQVAIEFWQAKGWLPWTCANKLNI